MQYRTVDRHLNARWWRLSIGRIFVHYAMQDDLVADMMCDIATQIAYISEYAQLLPGDIICTVTPGGCGTHHGRYLRPGDLLKASAPGFGAQRVNCNRARVPAM